MLGYIYIYREREREREMHSSSLVNIHPILRMEPKTKMVIVNHTFLTCIMCYILEPNWSLLLLVNMQDRYLHHFTTSFGIWNRITTQWVKWRMYVYVCILSAWASNKLLHFETAGLNVWKVTHSAGQIMDNTRRHHLCWGDQELHGTTIGFENVYMDCGPDTSWQTSYSICYASDGA